MFCPPLYKHTAERILTENQNASGESRSPCTRRERVVTIPPPSNSRTYDAIAEVKSDSSFNAVTRHQVRALNFTSVSRVQQMFQCGDPPSSSRTVQWQILSSPDQSFNAVTRHQVRARLNLQPSFCFASVSMR